MDGDKLRIFLITGHQYPVGTAMTNRMRSYLEVLAELGHDVSVLIYRPSEVKSNIQNNSQGELNGVKYFSSAYSIIKAKNPIIARLTWVYGYLNAFRILYKENKSKHIDVILQASSKSSIIPLVYLLTRFTKTKFVIENNEYPWFILKKKKSNWFYKFIYLRIYYRLFDGFILMTENLMEYHKKYSKKTATMIHLPMTVDYERFNINSDKENLITYVGNRSYYKDGVNVLIQSFAKISDKFPDWKLMIVGNTTKDEYIKEYFTKLKLKDRVILTGVVHRDEIPELVCKSKILVLSRPNNKQAEGGFPTKLGEYLASGNLVIASSVGEIPNYLTNHVNALLALSDNIDMFSDRLVEGMANYKQLANVRNEGRNLAKNVFSAKIQGKRLSDYFIDLIK